MALSITIPTRRPPPTITQSTRGYSTCNLPYINCRISSSYYVELLEESFARAKYCKVR